MTNMATAARPKRTVAPKATTKAEVPATPAPKKASFLARAKVTVVKTARRVVAFVKTTAKAVIARVKPIAKRAWTVALRPYLGGVLSGTALGIVVIGVFVAPVTTILTLLVSGGMFFLLARFVTLCEETADISRVARVSLFVLEVIGQALRAFAYAASAVLAVAMCSVSLPFAVASVLLLALGYLDVRGAGTIAFLAWCVFSGSWGFGLLWLMWRGAARVALKTAVNDQTATDVPEYSEIRRRPEAEHAHVLRADHVAVGTEETADLIIPEPSWDQTYDNVQACEACGTSKGAARIRSNALPFVTAGAGIGKPLAPSSAMLCSSCYDAECEDNAIALTGVSLARRSVSVTLNAVARGLLPEVAASKADVTQVFWATTAWWRDRRGNHHERQWDCFHDGKAVATITYDHDRKVYRATALGKFLGTKTGLGVAKRLATDALFDEGNAVTRMVEALAPAEESAS